MLDVEVVENGPIKCSGRGFIDDSAVRVSGSAIVAASPEPILSWAEPVLKIAPVGGVSTISSVIDAVAEDEESVTLYGTSL